VITPFGVKVEVPYLTEINSRTNDTVIFIATLVSIIDSLENYVDIA
jgi:hypothetical protein